MKWRSNPLNCGYVAGSITLAAGNFGFISLYNNDKQGLLMCIWDIGRGATTGLFAGYQVLDKQQGSNPVTPSPLVTNQGVPSGQLTTGSAGAVPTISAMHGLASNTTAWYHDLPFLILANGWSVSVWNPTSAAKTEAGFMYELVDMATVMDAYAPPTLQIPKIITLTVETGG